MKIYRPTRGEEEDEESAASDIEIGEHRLGRKIGFGGRRKRRLVGGEAEEERGTQRRGRRLVVLIVDAPIAIGG